MITEEAVVTSIILSLLVDFSKTVLAGNAKLAIKKIKDNATHIVSRFATLSYQVPIYFINKLYCLKYFEDLYLTNY